MSDQGRNGLIRGFGLLQATALNMTNMVGIGPFIVLPDMIAVMGGPQCMLGWLLGAIVSLCDGLVWAELAAAMPGAGGTYLYFREAYRSTRMGALLPFLFVWQFIFSGPLEVASGYIGFSQYVGYFWTSMGPWASKAVAAAVGIAAVALLYRQITAISRMTVVLWVGMLALVGWILLGGVLTFDPARAFDFPPGAFNLTMGFALGLGSAMRKAVYAYLGYYDICYVGGEVRNPQRVIPRAIVYSVLAVAAMYLLINLAVIGLIPWREATSPFVVAQFMERAFGSWAGSAVTVLILWAAFASVFALLLGYSRIPYAAALEGHFFRPFARLHPRGQFPHVSLLVIGGVSIAASFLTLGAVIDALLTARILVQFIGQIWTVHYIRTRRTDIRRPFRMWLYPLPSLIALAGWVYLFATAGWQFILYGVLTLIAGVIAWWLWSEKVQA